MIASVEDPAAMEEVASIAMVSKSLLLLTSSPTSAVAECELISASGLGVMSLMRSSSRDLRWLVSEPPAELPLASKGPSSVDGVVDSGVVVRLILNEIADGRYYSPNVVTGPVDDP